MGVAVSLTYLIHDESSHPRNRGILSPALIAYIAVLAGASISFHIGVTDEWRRISWAVIIGRYWRRGWDGC